MIKINISNAAGDRATVLTVEDKTVRQIIEESNIAFSNCNFLLNGDSISNAELDRKLSEYNLSEDSTNFLTGLVNKSNA